MNKRYYEHTLPIIRGSLSNTYYLFTLWILNENIDISISPDAELNLEELKFNSQVAGNDGFWN